ncbi:MAG: 4Fe-4S binding protein [Myxococcota bacterium]
MLFLRLRRAYQLVFLGLFLYLVFVTTASLIGGYPVEWFLGLDPLVATSTALASHALTLATAWAIPLIVLTLIFGRFFCGWMCPFGTLHHALGWASKIRRARDRVALNRPRRIYHLKYYVLLVMLGMAAMGSTQVGLLDPIAFTWRALATSIVPAIDNTALGLYQGQRHFQTSTLIVALFLGALAANLYIPRLYCRLICPLGGLLGLLARFSLFRLEKQPSLCTECDFCGADCQGAAEPQGTLRVSECMLCLNCQVTCPREGIRYRFLPSLDLTTDKLDFGRRQSLGALLGGIAAVPLLRASDGTGPRPNPQRIRPPGAVEEEAFLSRCIKCGACMKACPTSGLQPALTEAGFEGLWTPVLVPRLGYCEQSCVLCSHVCPTEALVPLDVERKIGKAPHTEPVRIGSAFIDRGRCLPWAMDTSCIVCEEVCPTAPKAVYFKEATVTTRDGGRKTLKQPYVDLDRCTGCGICETRCPVFDQAAIRVTSVGETRSGVNRIMLTGGRI